MFKDFKLKTVDMHLNAPILPVSNLGEGVHPVRVNTRPCALDAQSHKLDINTLDFATPYQVRGKDCTSTRHSEPFLLDFQVRSVILSLNIYPREESRELHAHQTQKTLLNITPSQPSPSREGVKTSSAHDGEVSRRDKGEIYKEVLC